jgi:citrate synthase
MVVNVALVVWWMRRQGALPQQQQQQQQQQALGNRHKLDKDSYPTKQKPPDLAKSQDTISTAQNIGSNSEKQNKVNKENAAEEQIQEHMDETDSAEEPRRRLATQWGKSQTAAHLSPLWHT